VRLLHRTTHILLCDAAMSIKITKTDRRGQRLENAPLPNKNNHLKMIPAVNQEIPRIK
jgi:hypothetical protein